MTGMIAHSPQKVCKKTIWRYSCMTLHFSRKFLQSGGFQTLKTSSMMAFTYQTEDIMQEWSAQFGARIKVMRRSRGLSQERLAEKAVIDSKFLSQLELGKRTPSLGTVQRIAHGLNIPVKDLFDFDHHSLGVRNELHKLVETLNDETAHKAYRILKVLAE
jgi:transcriptional regulator with XRE-family HTH domain